MLKDIVRAQYHDIVEYDLRFDDGARNGFSFPCDESGNLLEGVPEEARANYLRCLAHPEKFVCFNKVIKSVHHIRDNAHGRCECGNEIELWDDYSGACQCDKCGKWYNIFGQELLPPSEWEDND